MTVEIDSVRPVLHDCRHLARAMLLQLKQDGLCVPLTLAITWPPRFAGPYRYYLEAAQVNGIVGHHIIAGPPTLALPTHAISSVSSIPR